MPFTPSHAVVALPFLRTPLAPAAIAVGAMTPDLPLFVRGTPLAYSLTHSFAWIPLTAILALGLLLVWRCGLRPATRELLPLFMARRLPATWDRSAAIAARETFSPRGGTAPTWAAAALLVVSLIIGVASHIAWDLFTHEGRWGVAVIPALDDRWGPLAGFKWLQYGSTVLGLGVLTVWAALWLRRADAGATVDRVTPTWLRWTWWVSLPVLLAGAWVVSLALLGPLTSELTPAHIAYRVMLPACALWAVVTIALCLAVQARRRGRRR